MLRFLKPIAYVCGALLFIMGCLMMAVTLFAAINEDPAMIWFMKSTGLTVAVAFPLLLLGRSRQFSLVARQLYLLTSASWVLMSLAGALPLYLGDFGLTPANAIFEAVSGITTTGSTILSGIETFPRSMLLWRSILQWLGGLGVIGMAVSILPFLRIGGMRLFHTESSDWSDKSTPRVQVLARMLVVTYVAVTIACSLCYWLVGMTPFDAVAHAMTTVSTGGYATDDRSMGRFGNPVLWVGTLFMLIGALPFTMIISFANRPRLALLADQQVVGLLGIIATMTAALSMYLALTRNFAPIDAITQSAFNLVSVITTTGYASSDYTLWGPFAIALFFIVMFIGGCSGSTSGGMKVFRFQLSYLFLRNQIQRLIHPQGVFVTLYNGKPLPDDIMFSAVAFSFLFFVCLAAFTLLLAMLGLDLVTGLTAAATALTNVGPGLGDMIGPAGNFSPLPDGVKWLLCVAMIMGRLELLTVIVLFSPIFWRG